jgi:hypothetical protein
MVCSELVSLLLCVLCSEGISAAELCCLQWICDSLPELSCLQWICHSLSKLNCLQRISIHCWKYVVCRESAFAGKSVLFAVKLWFTFETELFAANQCSLSKVCVLQWICDSLPKLNCLQRISIRCWKCVVYSESAFTVEVVLSTPEVWLAIEIELPAVNYLSLLKACWLQRISIRCWNCVVWSESVFVAECVLSATKLWFAVEIKLPTMNRCSLPKVCVLQRICDLLPKLNCL